MSMAEDIYFKNGFQAAIVKALEIIDSLTINDESQLDGLLHSLTLKDMLIEEHNKLNGN